MKWHYMAYISMLVICAWISHLKVPEIDHGRTPQSVESQNSMAEFAASAGQ